MKKVGLFFILTLIICHSFSQTFNNTNLNNYYKLETLIKRYEGEKIKRIMADYQHDKIFVITKQHTFTITKKEAVNLGIISPPPSLKKFEIKSLIYKDVMNIVELSDINTQTEKIISDDGIIYYDENKREYRAEVYIPDTAVFYKVNKITFDTIGVCVKEVLEVSPNENIRPEISFGNINGKLVTKELLKEQTEIKIPVGYELVNTTFYFAGPGFNFVQVRSIKSKSISSLQQLFDSCKNESTIILDNIIVNTPHNKLVRASIPSIKVGSIAKPFDLKAPKIQFGAVRESRVEHNFFKRQRKLYVSEEIEFVSSMVYFVGPGFDNVNSVLLLSQNLSEIESYLKRCIPGTQVIFDNFSVKTKDGKIRTIEGLSFSLY